jgi:anaerobic selenocysteine-containing dehydrogenase
MGFQEEFFRQGAEELLERVLSIPSPMRKGIDQAAFEEGRGVELPLAGGYKTQFKTPSGKIEILNPREKHPLPRSLPTCGGEYPFRLMTGPSRYGLNSSFREREELRRKDGAMFLQMNPSDAGRKGVGDGERVVAFNELGEVVFLLRVSQRVPAGVVVAEGVWWLDHCPGSRSVNALTSQRLTDQGAGSTFYDNTVDVRKEGP